MVGLPRNSLRTHPQVLHWWGPLKGHPFPGLAAPPPGTAPTTAATRATRLFLAPLMWPTFLSPGRLRSRLPRAGCLKQGRWEGFAPPLTHCRPGIVAVDRWGNCKVTHIGRSPDRRLSEAAEEWRQGSGGGGPCLNQAGPQLHSDTVKDLSKEFGFVCLFSCCDESYLFTGKQQFIREWEKKRFVFYQVKNISVKNCLSFCLTLNLAS